jgi:hypothetical protein
VRGFVDHNRTIQCQVTASNADVMPGAIVCLQARQMPSLRKQDPELAVGQPENVRLPKMSKEIAHETSHRHSDRQSCFDLLHGRLDLDGPSRALPTWMLINVLSK